MAYGPVNTPGVSGEELKAQGKRLDGLLADLNQLVARVELLELAIATEIKANAFTQTFSNLEGLQVTGVWNAEQQQLEF